MRNHNLWQHLVALKYKYKRKVVPFRVTQAPGIFQRHMDQVFKEFRSFACAYVDDLLVFSNTKEEHLIRLLEKTKEYGIVL